MKRSFTLLLSLTVIVIISGCSGVTQEEYNKIVAERDSLKEQLESLIKAAAEEGIILPDANQNTDNKDITTPEVKNFDEATVISQLEVQEYKYLNIIKDSIIILVVKNNSDFDINLGVDLVLKDGTGQIIGAGDEDVTAFESGTEIALIFSNDKDPAKLEYRFNVSEEEYYSAVISDLSYEASLTQKKAIISVTNNGEYAAEFVEGTALFFEDGKIVDHDTTFFTDDDNELKPNKTIHKEMRCFDDFDSVKVYFTGWR